MIKIGLEEVKEYLRIDEEDDDSTILIMIDAAKDFIKDAVGSFDEESQKVKLLFFMVMQDFYENRVLSVKEADRQRLSYVASTIIMQLQADELLKEGDEIVD